jgi:hypothetical protein
MGTATKCPKLSQGHRERTWHARCLQALLVRSAPRLLPIVGKGVSGVAQSRSEQLEFELLRLGGKSDGKDNASSF